MSRDRKDSVRSRSRSRERSRRDRSHSRDRRDDRYRKRRPDDVRETEDKDSLGRERKEKGSDREKSLEVDKVKEKVKDKEAENLKVKSERGDIEDGEIYENLPVAEKPKPNGGGLSSTIQDVKKTEPLSLEEILRKRKEDAVQQAKVGAKWWEPNARLLEFCSRCF